MANYYTVLITVLFTRIELSRKRAAAAVQQTVVLIVGFPGTRYVFDDIS